MQACVPLSHARKSGGLRFSPKAPDRRVCVVLTSQAPAPSRRNALRCIRDGTGGIVRQVWRAGIENLEKIIDDHIKAAFIAICVADTIAKQRWIF
jgi:hypothetical protein